VVPLPAKKSRTLADLSIAPCSTIALIKVTGLGKENVLVSTISLISLVPLRVKPTSSLSIEEKPVKSLVTSDKNIF